jgi:ubiquinone/menaquinone biosynthesis C-methylase UbiE
LLTVDFTKFLIKPGDRVLDLGCGAGRHSFEAFRRGARVVAADLDVKELPPVGGMFAAMREAGEAAPPAGAAAVSADATNLPFPDGAFDAIIAAEILEHIPDDTAAIAEIARVLRPGGTVAVTVPAWLPERICWALSREYHEVPGGHVRIFTRAELGAKLTAAGLTPTGGHHAHGLHSAYWWLKCAVGVHDDAHPAVRAYHRLLVWDIMSKPALTRLSEAALNPLIGKSLVVYAKKAETQTPITPNGFAVPATRARSLGGSSGGFGGVVPPGEQSDLAGSGASE